MYFLYNKADIIFIRNEVNHMARGAGKNNWALFLLLLAGASTAVIADSFDKDHKMLFHGSAMDRNLV